MLFRPLIKCFTDRLQITAALKKIYNVHVTDDMLPYEPKTFLKKTSYTWYIFTNFHKRANFCDFQFAFLHNKSLLEKDGKCFLVSEDPFSEGRLKPFWQSNVPWKNTNIPSVHLISYLPYSVTAFPLKQFIADLLKMPIHVMRNKRNGPELISCQQRPWSSEELVDTVKFTNIKHMNQTALMQTLRWRNKGPGLTLCSI